MHEQSVTYHVQVTATIRLPTGILRESQLSEIEDENTIFVPLPGSYTSLGVNAVNFVQSVYGHIILCSIGLPSPQNVGVVSTSNSSVSLSWNIPPPPRDEIMKFQVLMLWQLARRTNDAETFHLIRGTSS